MNGVGMNLNNSVNFQSKGVNRKKVAEWVTKDGRNFVENCKNDLASTNYVPQISGQQNLPLDTMKAYTCYQSPGGTQISKEMIDSVNTNSAEIAKKVISFLPE